MKPISNIIHGGFMICLALGVCLFFNPGRVMADADEGAAGNGSTLVAVQTGTLKTVTLHRNSPRRVPAWWRG
jgi:hypothetical protein